VAIGIQAMPASTEKKRSSGVKKIDTTLLRPIATPSGMLTRSASTVPTATRPRLAATWRTSVPSSRLAQPARATDSTVGKIRGLTPKAFTTTSQSTTRPSSGRTNRRAERRRGQPATAVGASAPGSSPARRLLVMSPDVSVVLGARANILDLRSDAQALSAR
jgi:hypothetical protein